MQFTQQAPRTRAELEALYAKRGELVEQLEQLSERQGQLVQQRLNAQAAGNPGVARELDARIQEFSARIGRLENEKLRADDMITEAVGRGIGREGVAVEAAPAPPPPPEPPVYVETTALYDARVFIRDNALPLLLGEALFFVLIGALMWRRAFKRAVQPPALGQLGTAVDAIALEVERISENQRYVTKLLNEKLLEPGAAAAQPIKSAEKVGRSD